MPRAAKPCSAYFFRIDSNASTSVLKPQRDGLGVVFLEAKLTVGVFEHTQQAKRGLLA